MKLSTRATYGLRAMIYLRERGSTDAVSLSTIAEEAKLPKDYLERLMSDLKRAKLVSATKGSSGGYSLVLDENINVWSIIQALETNKGIFLCAKQQDKGNCASNCACGGDSSIVYIEEEIKRTLENISLKDLAKTKINE